MIEFKPPVLKIGYETTMKYHIGIYETEEDLKERISLIDNQLHIVEEYASAININEQSALFQYEQVVNTLKKVKAYKDEIQGRINRMNKEYVEQDLSGYGSRID